MAGFKFKERVERPVERFDRNFDPDARIGRNTSTATTNTNFDPDKRIGRNNTNTTTSDFDPDKRIPFDPDKRVNEY